MAPSRTLVRVVLPAPFGPMRPTSSGPSILNETPFRTWKRLSISLTSSRIMGPSPLLRPPLAPQAAFRPFRAEPRHAQLKQRGIHQAIAHEAQGQHGQEPEEDEAPHRHVDRHAGYRDVAAQSF